MNIINPIYSLSIVFHGSCFVGYLYMHNHNWAYCCCQERRLWLETSTLESLMIKGAYGAERGDSAETP